MELLCKPARVQKPASEHQLPNKEDGTVRPGLCRGGEGRREEGRGGNEGRSKEGGKGTGPIRSQSTVAVLWLAAVWLPGTPEMFLGIH